MPNPDPPPPVRGRLSSSTSDPLRPVVPPPAPLLSGSLRQATSTPNSQPLPSSLGIAVVPPSNPQQRPQDSFPSTGTRSAGRFRVTRSRPIPGWHSRKQFPPPPDRRERNGGVSAALKKCEPAPEMGALPEHSPGCFREGKPNDPTPTLSRVRGFCRLQRLHAAGGLLVAGKNAEAALGFLTPPCRLQRLIACACAPVTSSPSES